MADLERSPSAEKVSEETRKTKSKSPSLHSAPESKRAKIEPEDPDSEDISKQYKRFLAAPKYNFNSEELYCICRNPDHGGELMISCDGCEEWFHTRCMKIDKAHLALIDKFFCKFCLWKGEGKTLWHRKCRSVTCFEPIDKKIHSKYCSEECGLRFLSEKLGGVISQAASSNRIQLSKGSVKFIINYSKSAGSLHKLGDRFPELPEIANSDFESLPETVKVLLDDNQTRQNSIRAGIDQSQTNSNTLASIKEFVKLLNGNVQEKLGSSSSKELSQKGKKKGKQTKVDLCCFDKLFLSITCGSDFLTDLSLKPLSETLQTFREEIDSIAQKYCDDGEDCGSAMCLKDRRKCLRHNGWLNLLADQVWKRTNELNESLEKLGAQKKEILRDYSISVYEGK